MTDPDEIKLSFGLRKGVKTPVTVSLPTGRTHVDSLNLLTERGRNKFAKDVGERFPGIDIDDLLEKLEEESAKQAASDEMDGSASDKEADLLVALAELAKVEVFHTEGGDDAETFASFERNGHLETWSLRSRGFGLWLSGQYYAKYKRVPASQARTDALAMLDAMARFEGPEYPVSLRVARHGEFTFLDLCNEDRSAVCISADGWTVVGSKDVPVRFVRRNGMLALPKPVHGGTLSDLRGLVNIPSETDFVLFVSVLTFYLTKDGPFPILVINGEHGSAKSTACEFARALVDPSQVTLRRPPQSERDLMIAAHNSWVIAFDNLSGINKNISDAICGLATGIGMGTRQLYTDNEEKLLSATRPVLMNGIDDFVSRADMMDRSVVLTLPSIRGVERKTKTAIRAEFNAKQAGILGVLLDGASMALKRQAEVKLAGTPRMADFAISATAAEPAFGWSDGTFIAAYEQNRRDMHVSSLESSIVGRVARILANEWEGEEWVGTATKLLGVVRDRAGEVSRSPDSELPKSPKAVASDLRRIAPALHALGVEVETNVRQPGGNRDRMIVIRLLPPDPSKEGGDCRDCRDCSFEQKNTEGAIFSDPSTSSSEEKSFEAPGVSQEQQSLQSRQSRPHAGAEPMPAPSPTEAGQQGASEGEAGPVLAAEGGEGDCAPKQGPPSESGAQLAKTGGAQTARQSELFDASGEAKPTDDTLPADNADPRGVKL